MPNNKMDSPLLNYRDVCSFLHLSRPTVSLLVKAGDLKPIRIGKSVRFSWSELERFCRERTA